MYKVGCPPEELSTYLSMYAVLIAKCALTQPAAECSAAEIDGDRLVLHPGGADQSTLPRYLASDCNEDDSNERRPWHCSCPSPGGTKTELPPQYSTKALEASVKGGSEWHLNGC